MNLLIVGASGYGNMGDDGYRLVFGEGWSGKHALVFDSPYPDRRAVDWADAVIVGGGGLIYCNETAHFDYMTSYLNRAIHQDKPIAFISCGVQIRPHETGPDFVNAGPPVIRRWAPYLEYASVVTVRSPTCLEIVKRVAPRQTNAHFVPDACYALAKAPYSLALPDSYVFIPTPTGAKSKVFRKYWERHKHEERVYVAAWAKDDYEIVDRLAAEVDPRGNMVARINLSPTDAMGIVQHARLVVTGRYHGAVYARAAGVPEERIVAIDRRYKAMVEVPPADPREAWRNITLLEEALATKHARPRVDVPAPVDDDDPPARDGARDDGPVIELGGSVSGTQENGAARSESDVADAARRAATEAGEPGEFMERLKHRVARMPLVGPKLRSIYKQMKKR